MSYLMKCGAGKNSHLLGSQIKPSGIIGYRIEEHRYSSEYHHCRHCDRRLVRLGTDCRLRTKNSGGTAYSTSDGGQQRCVLVHLQKTTYPYSAKNRDCDDNQIYYDSSHSDIHYILKCQPESIQYDSETQHFL